MLFGALLIAPASTFVGCSDYDDDISSLQQQIDVNKSTLNDLLAEKVNDIQSQLEALKKADSDLDAAFKDADAALKQAQEAGDKAVLDKVASEYATVAAAKELVANAKDELQKALDSKAEELIAKDAELTEGVSAAKAAAAAAQSTADQALALAQEASDLAQKNADAIKAVNGALNTQATKLEELSGTLAEQAKTLGELSTKIDDVKKTLEEQITSLSDDINEKLGEVNDKIAAIKGQIAALEAFKTTQEATNTDLQNQIDALVEELDGVKGYLEGKLRVQIEGMIGEAEARIMESVDEVNTTISDLKSAYDQEFIDLKARMDDVEAAITTLNDETIPGIEEKIGKLEQAFDIKINTLRTTLSNVLRSIVFKPELYVGGIESQEYGYMRYQVWDIKDEANRSGKTGVMTGVPETPNYEITEDASNWDYEGIDSYHNVAPAIAVKYHLNPSNAEVDADKLAFISHNAQVINRASEEEPEFVTEFYTDINDKAATQYNKAAVDGVLTVGMKVDADKLWKLYGAGAGYQTPGSVFALQAKVAPDEVEQLITSDYAQIYPSEITPKKIAFNKKEYQGVDCTPNTNNDELYGDANSALQAKSSYSINYKAYKAEDGIDLKKLFQIHYEWASETENGTAAGTHDVLENGAEKKFGLSYDFKLIDYNSGSNNTRESQYAEIVGDGILVTRTVKNGSRAVPASDNEAHASIGRHPLIRVRVLDAEKNVVLVGFFHLQIVETQESKVADTRDLGVQRWNCAGITGEADWAYVSEAILNLGLSSEDFDLKYTLETTNGHAQQYILTSENPIEETLLDDDTERIGKIRKIQDASSVTGATTSKIVWELSGLELQTIYDMPDHTYKVWVKFVRNNSSATSWEGHIYVPFQITVKKEEIAEVSKKVSTHWKNNAFQWNVVEPSEGNKISQYAPSGSLSNGGMQQVMWTDFDYAWMNSAPEWDTKDNFYAQYSTGVGVGAANTAYKYYFVPEKNDFVYRTVGNATFTDDEIDEFAAITAQDIMDNHVNDAGTDYKYKYGNIKVFNCNKIYKKVEGVEYLICEMNQTTGEVVWNTYGTGKEVAREVLNANPYTEFTVGMITRHKNCFTALPLLIDGSLAKFKVHALRPITMASSKNAAVTDADRSTYNFSIYDCLTFTDWRNIKFSAKPWLFKFYEIKSVDIDYSAITAVIDGVEKELSIAKPEVTITKTNGTGNLYDADTADKAKKAMGKITYVRNSGSPVVTKYQIKVPVYVTYALSAGNDDMTLRTVITIDVKPSIQ